MNYYTYKLVFKNDPRYYYYGVRRSLLPPEEDPYLGSGRGIQELKVLYGKDCFTKTIVEKFNNRQDSLLGEERLVGDLWKTDPFCLNRMPGGAFRGEFDAAGLVTYHKGSKIRHIRETAIPEFEKQGWVKGLPESRAEELRRYIVVTDGVDERRIFPEDLQEWKERGWKRGRSERNLKSIQGRISIHSGSLNRGVQKEFLQEYLAKGWQQGHSEEHTARITAWNRGSVYIFKEDKTTKVRKEDLPKYLAEGWQRGNLGTRKPKTESQKARSRETQKGRVWINNGTTCKKIWPQDRENYPNWVDGRLSGQAPTTRDRVRMYNPTTGERIAAEQQQVSQLQERGFVRGRGW